MTKNIRKIPIDFDRTFFIPEDEHFDFTDTQDLLEIDFVKNWRTNIDGTKDDYFYRYSLKDKDLVVEFNKGKNWVAIGNINDVSNLILPKWKSNEENPKRC